MKKIGHSRRLLSVLLALVMLLSLLPTAVFAADPTPQTFKKVTSAEELVTGQYVLVDEKGFSPKELSGKWVTTAAVTVNGATATAYRGHMDHHRECRWRCPHRCQQRIHRPFGRQQQWHYERQLQVVCCFC